MKMKEIWRDIVGYEGLYQVSNLGRVRSLDRKHEMYQHKKKQLVERKIKGKIIRINKRVNGYLFVVLYKNGEGKSKNVHRLIAEAFIPNPNNLPQVNHKDGNKCNNTIENLEWCTASYNVKHAFDNGLKFVSEKQIEFMKKLGKNSYRWRNKSVLQMSLNGKILKKWDSLTQASKETKINKANIGKCCKKERKTAGGYIWEYELVKEN